MGLKVELFPELLRKSKGANTMEDPKQRTQLGVAVCRLLTKMTMRG
jgi:hypothetical protein